jgi:hypothetical protein
MLFRSITMPLAIDDFEYVDDDISGHRELIFISKRCKVAIG